MSISEVKKVTDFLIIGIGKRDMIPLKLEINVYDVNGIVKYHIRMLAWIESLSYAPFSSGLEIVL